MNKQDNLSDLKSVAFEALDSLDASIREISERARTMPEEAEKRAQLKAVSQSIHQLEGIGIPVPDELRHLRTTLVCELEVADTPRKILLEIGEALKELMARLDSLGMAGRHRRSRNRGSSDEGITPIETLKEHLLQAIRALGGRAHPKEILDWIEEEHGNDFLPGDLEVRPSGSKAWHQRVHYARYRMAQKGILRRDSPVGLWQLTEDHS
ncbi:hypothetical protein J7M28_06570 [bacterium]|nr:hypothetical protein [bacterium]